MKNKILFEVCAFNIQSCIIAERAGAARVELCDNPIEGGTTPSYGTIKLARKNLKIKLYPIIRPHSGNYYYDNEDMVIVKEDILMCKNLGCDGVSVGVQKRDGTIDKDKLSSVVEWAYPMGVTCNRAFDAAPDPFQALEDIIDTGCERILTSGQKSTAPQAGSLLKELVQKAGDRIIIMPGAGINASNISILQQQCGAREFHGSARVKQANPMNFTNPAVLDAGDVYITDEEELTAIISILEQIR
jgi:copper homeostasis protein